MLDILGKEREKLNQTIARQEAEVSILKGEVALLKKELKELQTQHKALKKENKANYEAFESVKEARDKRDAEIKELKETIDSNKSALTKLRKENNENYENYKKLKTLSEHTKKKLADQDSEQELFVLQIAQARDEIAKKNLQLQELSTLNQSLSGKLSRLLAKAGGQIDFAALEIIQIDSISAVPQIVWKISDYSQGSQAVPDFYFRTTLQDGLGGLGLVDHPKTLGNAALDQAILIPSLIANQAAQADLFKSLSAQQWAQIVAAAAVLEQLILSKGKNLKNAGDFDYSFWQNSLIGLVTAIKRLPTLLRYQKVKLKRELQNPDYEHLWLEFYEMEYLQFKLPKFEMRLGAAAIEPAGFSQFPKLEFPLIDGRTKPFASWFAESADDFGQKYELRFALDKRTFDLNNFMKLSEADQRLMHALILVLPSALNQLARSKISIHRQWATWGTFVNQLGAIFQSQVRAYKPELLAPKVVEPSAGKPSGSRQTSQNAAAGLVTEPPKAPKQDTIEASATASAPQVLLKSKSVSVVVAQSAPRKLAPTLAQKVTKKVTKKAAKKVTKNVTKRLANQAVTKSPPRVTTPVKPKVKSAMKAKRSC